MTDLLTENARLRAALEAAPIPRLYVTLNDDGSIEYGVTDECSHWYDVTRAEALRHE